MSRTIRTSLFVLAALVAMPAAAADLTLDLAGIRTQAGHLQIALVDSEGGWNEQAPPVRAERVAATAERLQASFNDLPPGDYAVMVMHDENDNGKLDTNIVGMPIEGFGFSNNPNVMRKPTWNEARFTVPAEGLAITIDLR